MLIVILINQINISKSQQQLIKESDTLITSKIDELYEKLDADTVVQVKECEIKAIQTLVNMFSPSEITKDSTLEYDFDIFNDETYEYYLMMRKTLSGNQLMTVSTNADYDIRNKKIRVFVSYLQSGYEGRDQFNFIFAKADKKWIIESIETDA